jgi:hypothetical protein
MDGGSLTKPNAAFLQLCIALVDEFMRLDAAAEEGQSKFSIIAYKLYEKFFKHFVVAWEVPLGRVLSIDATLLGCAAKTLADVPLKEVSLAELAGVNIGETLSNMHCIKSWLDVTNIWGNILMKDRKYKVEAMLAAKVKGTVGAHGDFMVSLRS